eukprot:4836082-Prymnesium_polylepis.1
MRNERRRPVVCSASSGVEAPFDNRRSIPPIQTLSRARRAKRGGRRNAPRRGDLLLRPPRLRTPERRRLWWTGAQPSAREKRGRKTASSLPKCTPPHYVSARFSSRIKAVIGSNELTVPCLGTTSKASQCAANCAAAAPSIVASRPSLR